MATWSLRVCMAMAAVMLPAVAAASSMPMQSRPSEDRLSSPVRVMRRFSRAMIVSDSIDVGNDSRPNCNPSTGCSGRNLMCCNGECVDVARSAQSCGACNYPCSYNRECCGGVCIDAHASDRLNCGACGIVCPEGVPCLFGMCGYSSGRIVP